MTTFLTILAAAASTILILHLMRPRSALRDGTPEVRLFGTYSPVLTAIRYRMAPLWRKGIADVPRLANSSWLTTGLEVLIIGLWSLWVGRNYLDLTPSLWPTGREFGAHIYGFHLWEQFWRCGACSLWNGVFNGGWPSLADPFSGFLHPLNAIAGSLAGAVNGAKLAVLGSIFMAGMAQWWLAHILSLGRWSRIWGALAAASGGHLLGRMEIGSVNLVLSTAATSLALAGALDLALKRNRRAALRLAVLLALAIFAGAGYMQLALIAWAPWIAVIALNRQSDRLPPWREFALAGGLSLMIAAIFLVPFAHTWPSLTKYTDPLFLTSQPFEYIPLNLVIHDWDFYLLEALGSTAFPYLHALYIGWPAVLLAAFGLARSRAPDRRLLFSLALGSLTMLWLASGTPLRWATSLLPGVAGIRHPALMAGLSIPAILALAGYGLDRLLELSWPVAEAAIGTSQRRNRVSVRLSYLVAVPLALALVSADQLGQSFLDTSDRTKVYVAIKVLKTSSLQWVSPPLGEHYWLEPAMATGLKVTHAALPPFWWNGRELPPPLFEVFRVPLPDESVPVAYLDEAPVYANPGADYAFVTGGTGDTPCRAQGSGGDLTVACDTDGGTLVVRENSWPGWTATVDGEPVRLDLGAWLQLSIPPGPVTVRLRYIPIDAIVGALMSVAGLMIAGWLWLRERRREDLGRHESGAAG